jgi:Glyoxalase/Bleomycin resistance protein/Dioxygenase superfamily
MTTTATISRISSALKFSASPSWKRWEPEGTELLLEPDAHPAAKPFKQALVEDGIPFTSFAVEEVRDEFERLRGLGVRFTQEPVEAGPVTTAVFDDTCGNLIQIASQR